MNLLTCWYRKVIYFSFGYLLPPVLKIPSCELVPTIQGTSDTFSRFSISSGSSVKNAPGWTGSTTGLNGIMGSRLKTYTKSWRKCLICPAQNMYVNTGHSSSTPAIFMASIFLKHINICSESPTRHLRSLANLLVTFIACFWVLNAHGFFTVPLCEIARWKRPINEMTYGISIWNYDFSVSLVWK